MDFSAPGSNENFSISWLVNWPVRGRPAKSFVNPSQNELKSLCLRNIEGQPDNPL